MKKIILLSFAFFMNGALAQNTLSFRNWSVTAETADPYLGVASCRVATGAVTPKVPFQLSFSFPKAFAKAPVAMITLGPELSGQKIELKLSSSQTEFALPLENRADGNTYWYIPLDLDFLIERIIKGSALEISVQLTDRKEALKVSLNGSGAALKEAAKCLGAEKLYQPEFFEALNDPSIAPSPVEGASNVTRLHDLFQSSYGFFIQRQQVEAQLMEFKEANEAGLQSEVDAKNSATAAAASLVESRNQLLNLDLQIQEKQTALESSKAQALTAKAKVSQAERALESARSRYEPLKKQYHAHEDAVLASKTQLEALMDQTIAIQEAIDAASGSLNALQSEAAKLDALVTADQRGLEQSKADQTRLSAELSVFNLEGKLRDLVQGDARIQTMNLEMTELRSSLTGQETSMREAQSVMIQAQRDFEQCRKENLANVAEACATQMAGLQKAQGNFNGKQGEVRQTNSGISSREGESKGIQNAYRADLVSQRDAIQTALNLATAQIETYEAQLTSNRARVAELRGTEIPKVNGSLQAAQSKKNDLEKSAAAAAVKLETTVNGFESFKVTQNYFEVEKEYVTAGQNFEKLKSESEAAAAKVAQSESELSAVQQTRPAVEAVIAERTTTKSQLDDALKAVQQSLSDVKAKEAQLTQDLALLKGQQDASMQQYRYVLFGVLGSN